VIGTGTDAKVPAGTAPLVETDQPRISKLDSETGRIIYGQRGSQSDGLRSGIDGRDRIVLIQLHDGVVDAVIFREAAASSVSVFVLA
jgi:hypothetical protein